LQINDVDCEADWNLLVERLDGHVRQSWPWGSLATRPVHRRAILADGDPVAAIALTEIALPGLPFTVLDAPRGPMLGRRSSNLWPALLDAIREVAEARRAIFVRLSPYVVEDSELIERLGEYGAIPLEAQWTLWNPPRVIMASSLEGTEAEVKRRMRESARLSIGKASRQGVVVARLTGDDAMPRLHHLLVGAGRRRGFPVRRLDYFDTLRRAFLDRDAGVVTMASHEGHDVAATCGVRFGRTAYVLYSGIDPAFRPLRAGYAAHWELIRWAREHGCDRMDWGGSVTQYPPAPEDEGYGIYDFKRGFGCDIVLLARYFDIVLRPGPYRIVRALEDRAAWLSGLRARLNR
jgi:lipid II:glycine glycyltransferase (peptidoglycan interpeptide bridge formation enzyme)